MFCFGDFLGCGDGVILVDGNGVKLEWNLFYLVSTILIYMKMFFSWVFRVQSYVFGHHCIPSAWNIVFWNHTVRQCLPPICPPNLLAKNLKRKMEVCLWILILWHNQLNEVIVLPQRGRKEIWKELLNSNSIHTDRNLPGTQTREHQSVANGNRIFKFKKQIARRQFSPRCSTMLPCKNYAY